MLPKFRNDVPELISLFDSIDQIPFENSLLKNANYCVMGQVCVGEGYRGMGFFDGMYDKLREVLSGRYELCITDISTLNTRSMAAHARVGFVPVHDFFDKLLNETWRIVLWDWRKTAI